MPVVKNKKTKKWEVFIRYKDIYGKNKRKHKTGFARESDAKKWEKEFLNTVNLAPDMSFKTIANLYLEDVEKRMKVTTLHVRKTILNKYILPELGDLPLNNINALIIRNFQNNLLHYNLSKSSLKTVEATMKVVFNYAEKYYNLKNNPTVNLISIGSKKTIKEMKIWTVDEFNSFIKFIEYNRMYYTIFNLLGK